MGRWRSNKVLYLKTIPVMTFHQTEGILNLANTHNFSLFGSADPQTDISSFFHLPGLPYLMMSREKKTQDFIKIGDNRLNVHSSWECHPVRIFARNIWELEGKEDIPWKWTKNQELVESINERLYGHMHMAHGFIVVCVVGLFKGANGCVDILISRCDPFLSFFSFVVKSE